MYADRFIEYIRFEKRYSNHTVTAYQNDLVQFFDFIKDLYDTTDPGKITHGMIRSWMVSLINSNVTSRSVNRKLSTLKSFYKFLIKEQIVTENPLVKIISPKTQKRLPEFVEEDKMDLLLNDLTSEVDFTQVRDKLIIEMFYFTGMRLSELINLKDHNISRLNGTIKVLGKRNKERIIPFGKELGDSIERYVKVRNRDVKLTEQKDYFFVSENGKKVYSKLVYQVVNTYLSKVSTKSKKSPHVLRHTFATHMLNNGADLNAIKELLGHSNLAATQVYTHNTIDKLKTIYKQAHPRA